MNESIGVVTYYFDHAQAAIIKLSSRLKVGDKVKILKDENEVE